MITGRAVLHNPGNANSFEKVYKPAEFRFGGCRFGAGNGGAVKCKSSHFEVSFGEEVRVVFLEIEASKGSHDALSPVRASPVLVWRTIDDKVLK